MYNYDGAIKLGIELAKIFPDTNIRIRPRDEQIEHMQDNPDKYTNSRIRGVDGEFDDDGLPHAWTAEFCDVGVASYTYLDRETCEANWAWFVR